MMGQEEVIIALQGQHGQLHGVPENDVADAPMAEGLHIVNYAVNLPPPELGGDVPQPVVY